jgi:hypothetical protein
MLNKSVGVILIGLVVAGCRLPCGGCAQWETCEASTSQCVVNAGARFDLIAVDGNVSNADRTILNGIPNPEICVDLGGEVCSVAETLTYSPTWNQKLAGDLDAASLLATPIPMRFVDSEPFGNSVEICDGNATITEAYLHASAFRFGCSNGSYVNFELKNVAVGTGVGDGGARGDGAARD